MIVECDLNMWQISAVHEGINALNEGRMISHEELKEQWGRKREALLDLGITCEEH